MIYTLQQDCEKWDKTSKANSKKNQPKGEMCLCVLIGGGIKMDTL